MDKLSKRIKAHSDISTELACYSDEQLSHLLAKAEHMHSGMGGKSVLLTTINGTKVFVKKITLTDLEKQPNNIMSTANYFELPLFYQYGVGSAGLGAWRELVSHIMTTNWVISGECVNFPIMYHWRVLAQPNNDVKNITGDLDEYIQYWSNSLEIRKRVDAIYNASSYILVFSEYIPQTLQLWLKEQLAIGGDVAEQAVVFVDDELKKTNDFINTHSLLHFDAHFENILTDGETVYFSDFGLALSTKFELSKTEVEFFKTHSSYDQASTKTNLLYSIITTFFGKDNWEIKLNDYLAGTLGELEPVIANIIKRDAAVALLMDDFYQKLQKVSKSTPYPAKQLEKLLAEIGNVKDEKTFAICPATEKESNQIVGKLIEFNWSKVITAREGSIFKNYVIKDNGNIIAGINTIIYRWDALYIDVLIVDQNYRGKGLGSALLHKIESEAEGMGVTLVHLETFDFQAKDFYLKHGYKVFGELENCPVGHKLYYFSKSL